MTYSKSGTSTEILMEIDLGILMEIRRAFLKDLGLGFCLVTAKEILRVFLKVWRLDFSMGFRSEFWMDCVRETLMDWNLEFGSATLRVFAKASQTAFLMDCY